MSFVKEPLLKSHNDMAFRLIASGIDYDLNAKWERGEERSDEAEQMARELADLDWLLYGNTLDFDFGGDGDSGEFLIDLIDVLLREPAI